LLIALGVHYPFFIEQFGMPKNQDSQLFERKHQDAIHDRKSTAGNADVLVQIADIEIR
jgi:hypothetical protein